MKETYKKAYFTVEASALMPFIIAFYFLFVYSLLYEYNLTLLSQDTYYLCEKVREAELENEDGKMEADRILGLLKAESPYLSCKNLTIFYSKKGYRISFQGNVDFDIPISDYLCKWFLSIDKKPKADKYTYLIKPQNIMRMAYILDLKQEGE